MADRIEGVVKWFNDGRGYGFIEANSVLYFAHYQEIIGEGHRTLLPYQRVEFVPFENAKGPRARDIKIVAASEAEQKFGT